MAESFLCIILVVLFGSFALSLLPDTSAKPYLRLLCGAAAVLSIISPLVLQIRDGSLSDGLLLLFEEQSVEAEKYEEIYNKTILTEGARKASRELKNEIKQELMLDSDGFDVAIVVEDNGDEIYIARVELIIYPSGLAIDPHAIQKYVKERLGCECVVIYE